MNQMSEPESSPEPVESNDPFAAAKRARLPGWIRLPLRWTLNVLTFIGLFLLIAWCVLAVYFSNLPSWWGRLAGAIAFAVFALWALSITRRRNARRAFAGACAAVVIWWIYIPPSNDRPWRPEVAVPPRAIINGDRATFTNFRHFTYRSRDDFDVRYEEREVDLARLVSVDLFLSYWKTGPVGHTFLSFNFDDGSPPVCVSIETRPEIGEGFDPLASMFKQFELIYVVGDERDIVRVRTDHRNEEVFLYRIRASKIAVQALFRVYLDRINKLADHPEWYHLLSNSCTVNIIRYSRAIGGPHRRFEVKHLLNGWIDQYMYHLGIVDTSLGFDELRARSHINDVARAVGDADDFSLQIRKSLPVPAVNGAHGATNHLASPAGSESSPIQAMDNKGM